MRHATRTARVACLALALTAGLSLGQAAKKGARRPEEPLRVLFIGNSLTYSNDLPAMVAALAKSAGKRPLVFQSVVEGGFSLEDHWDRGDAQRAIAQGKWDVVVLQQGPSSLD